MLERVFWTKDKMIVIRQKLKTLKNKIYAKTKKDFAELIYYIDSGDEVKVL